MPPVLVGEVAIVAGAVLVHACDAAACVALGQVVAPHDARDARFHGRADEQADQTRVAFQYVVGAAPDDDARPLVGDGPEDVHLGFVDARGHRVLDVGAAEEAVGVQQQRPHGLFVEVFHHVAAEAALLRDALEQELIVVRDAQLAGKALADLAAAASILPADGENEMLVHAGPFRVPANSTRFR